MDNPICDSSLSYISPLVWQWLQYRSQSALLNGSLWMAIPCWVPPNSLLSLPPSSRIDLSSVGSFDTLPPIPNSHLKETQKVPRRSVRQEAEVSVGVRNTFLRAHTVWLPSAEIPQWIAHLRTPMPTMCCRKLMTFMYLLKTQWRWEPLWLSTHIVLKTAPETEAFFTEVRSSARLTRLQIQGSSIPAKANILSSSTGNWP